MLKFKKILIFMVSCFLVVMSMSLPLKAEGKNVLEPSVETKWWPGNPNPAPGSEAWLQLYGYTAPKNVETARRCAVEALGIAPTASSLISWLAKGVYTVSSFCRTFGADFVGNYFSCVLKTL